MTESYGSGSVRTLTTIAWSSAERARDRLLDPDSISPPFRAERGISRRSVHPERSEGSLSGDRKVPGAALRE
jgi:hypothetical protein